MNPPSKLFVLFLKIRRKSEACTLQPWPAAAFENATLVGMHHVVCGLPGGSVVKSLPAKQETRL